MQEKSENKYFFDREIGHGFCGLGKILC